MLRTVNKARSCPGKALPFWAKQVLQVPATGPCLCHLSRFKIYTKTGDSGTSSLYDGTRLPKDSDFFKALGEAHGPNRVRQWPASAGTRFNCASTHCGGNASDGEAVMINKQTASCPVHHAFPGPLVVRHCMHPDPCDRRCGRGELRAGAGARVPDPRVPACGGAGANSREFLEAWVGAAHPLHPALWQKFQPSIPKYDTGHGQGEHNR